MAVMENHSEDFAGNLKEVFHYPKVNAQRYERNTCSTTDSLQNIWSCVAYESEGKRGILVKGVSRQGNCFYEKTLGTGNCPARPFLGKSGDEIEIIWVEHSNNECRICLATKKMLESDFKGSIIHTCKNAVLDPRFLSLEDKMVIVWSQYNKPDKKFEIYSVFHGNNGPNTPAVISESRGNCFRPCIAGGSTKIYIAWDEGNKGKQKITVLEEDLIGNTFFYHTIERSFERLTNPSLAIGKDDICHLACISIKDVTDEKMGISDHSTGIVSAIIKEGRIHTEKDLIADLDEGLLGIENYVPYFGIRRKCSLSSNQNGDLFLTWEMRFENEPKAPPGCNPDNFSEEHFGNLAGMVFSEDKWSSPFIIHSSGTCYSVADFSTEKTADISYLLQNDVFILPELKVSCKLMTEQDSLVVERSKSIRWNGMQKKIRKDFSYTSEVNNQNLSLFWGDTHVHSNLSPDAEGNPDELALYGRDIAGLDFMAMVDNDYYPHAGLTEFDWNIQLELASAFTKPGEFVLFPGFEFTYHDKSISPNFNHRYIIYPEKGPLCSRLSPETRYMDSLSKVLEKTQGIMVAHHPDWNLSKSRLDRFVEICSSWRISMEEKNFIKQSLEKGGKFAFIGSSDTHRACPGLGGALTGIYSSNLDPHSLFEGYKKRRTIATQGLRIAVDFHLNDLFIGDEGTIKGKPVIKINVLSPEELEYVEIYRGDEVIKKYIDPGKTFKDDFTDTDAPTGNHYYYVRAKAKGDPSFNEPLSRKDESSGPFSRKGDYPFNFARAQGPFAWTTPIWCRIIK